MGAPDDDKALLYAARERAEIVKRYDVGRDPGAIIDDWEDPELKVYQTTDRYGFIHDDPVLSEDSTEKKAKERERTQKWEKMFKEWDKKYVGDHPSKVEKMRGRVWKGIPDSWRGEIWKRLLQIDDLKESQKGVYERMRERARTTSPDIRQIDLDVNRTYRNHIMFRERFGIKQKHLFHVLAAYSMYNTEVGYCQGMSQIAALLLMYMDEEEAFWGLSQLLTDKKHAMHGLFIPGFPKLMRYQNHFENVLKKYMKKIYKFMNANMIPPSLYAIKWFMQCFLDRTPFTLTLRLWDVFILDGERILIPMAYTIFKVHRKKLLGMQMENFVGFLQHELEKDFGLDDDAVLVELQANMEDLRRSRIDVPPKPTTNDEVPQKPFGCVTYPTEEELLKRQKAQIHINDQPTTIPNGLSSNVEQDQSSRTIDNQALVTDDSIPRQSQIEQSNQPGAIEQPPQVQMRNSNVPKHLVSQNSFASVYDNQPGSPSDHVRPIPAEDYQIMSEPHVIHADKSIKPRYNAQSSGSSRKTSRGSVTSTHSNANESHPKRPMSRSSASGEPVQPTNGSPHPGRQAAAALSSELLRRKSETGPAHPPRSSDGLSSDLSSIEVVELKLDLSDEEESKDAVSPTPQRADSFFEKELEQTLDDRDRSRSISKSPDIDADNSHMYVRAAGFRGKNLSPPQNNYNSMSKQRTPPTPPPRSASNDVMASYHKLPDGSVQIPVTHLGNSPRSPDDRIAYNPGYGRQPGAPPGVTRPFPVPRNLNMSNTAVTSLPGHAAANNRAAAYNSPLRMISPTSTGHPIVSKIPVYQYQNNYSNTPVSRGATSPTSPTSPPYNRQAFHTFGGRGRQNQQGGYKQGPPPSIPVPQDRTMVSGARNMMYPQQQGSHSHSTLPTRFVNQRPQIPPSVSGNKTFYVVGDNRQMSQNKQTYRYGQSEEDPNQKPVFL